MNSPIKNVVLFMAAFLTLLPGASMYANASPQAASSTYSADELDQLLATVALYPDPLLAQMLPAASFVDQISQAQSLLNGQVDERIIRAQNWDVSVKAIAHYPPVLRMMSDNRDWTVASGQAFVTQPQDVASSIQRLRAQAKQQGALESNSQQQVSADSGYIQVEPAESDTVYIPVYGNDYGYGYGGYYGYGSVSYSGYAIGAWLNRDWDWSGRGPYYHGWNGRGWINNSRNVVDTGNRTYVNNNFGKIDVNRNVLTRDVGNFRRSLDQSVMARHNPMAARPPAMPPGNMAPRTKPLPAAPRPLTPPSASPRLPAAPHLPGTRGPVAPMGPSIRRGPSMAPPPMHAPPPPPPPPFPHP